MGRSIFQCGAINNLTFSMNYKWCDLLIESGIMFLYRVVTFNVDRRPQQGGNLILTGAISELLSTHILLNFCCCFCF